MSRVLFVDATCPKPYSPTTLTEEAMGGTEATVVRVAEGLANRGHEVVVAQHNRRNKEKHAATYTENTGARFDVVVALRVPVLATNVACLAPRSFLWLHDWATTEFRDFSLPMSIKSIGVICVSDTHKAQVGRYNSHGRLQMHTIYNPIDNHLEGAGLVYDNYKLSFFSSPHKGLANVLRIFKQLHHTDPRFHLYISNPGYFKLPSDVGGPGLTVLGPLPHAVALQHVKESLCVFYPNDVFPETFGLVFAEANALGTPVLTHDVGAAREVLVNPDAQLVEPNDAQIIARVMDWSSKPKLRPLVHTRAAFKLDNVLDQWENTIK